jgi:methyl-accepting chemotaxis protein
MMNTTAAKKDDQKIKFWASLRGRITGQMLLIALLPLIILSVIFLTSLNQAISNFGVTVNQVYEAMAKEMIGSKLQALAEEAMVSVDTYMLERIHDLQDWASTPVITNAIKETVSEAEEFASQNLTIEQTEKLVGNKRELLPDSQAKAFLQKRVAQNPAFKEIFFTDNHGYNVAVSNPTSDFIQSDEEWWQVAWNTGIYISPVTYDESSQVYAVDIAMRINDPNTGQPLGVMKTSLDISAIQDKISEMADKTAGSEVILFEEDGYRLADSASNHSSDLIMTDAGNLSKVDYAPVNLIRDSRGSGYLLNQASLNQANQTDELGYAHSADTDFYQSVFGFNGFNWSVLYIQPTSVAFQALEPIIKLQKDLDDLQQSTTLSVFVVGILTAIGSVIFALFLSNSISKPIVELSQITKKIARGHLDTRVNIERRDEIGEMANAFRQMVDYQQTMAGAAAHLARGDVAAAGVTPQSEEDVLGNAFVQMIGYQQQMSTAATRLAQGDLTIDVIPKSESDVLGNAFKHMTTNLRTLIAQVQGSVIQVATSSQQLNTAAEQTGQASQQVVATIQQVAQGNTQQTHSLTEATNNIEQIANAANGIAKGAQEQAQAMQQTSILINDMAALVGQAGNATGLVMRATANVTQAAYQGVNAVEQTGRGMATIRTRVSAATEKVKEMNLRSKEIGRIVEAIDAIADKTDMLALNAAVEAARAGEQGRGFAVVADHVRKLSEHSKVATGDIATLIERVQETISEAITAIESAVAEVDNGAHLTENASQSLQDILRLAEEAAGQAKTINQVMTNLQQKSEGVVEASGTVSAVVEENIAVAEELATNSEQVTVAMESVASVAEENSASAEEVSAAAEEMSAQIEEVVASAEELSAMAEQLRMATARFQVSQNPTNPERGGNGIQAYYQPSSPVF